MMKQRDVSPSVTTSVTQAPSKNFSRIVTVRMRRHRTAATTWIQSFLSHSGSRFLREIQNRLIPMFERENVTKTLIAYITTSLETSVSRSSLCPGDSVDHAA